MASHPIIVLVILFLASYVVSTVVSILPRISFWGYYDRLYGLYTVGSFLVIFFSMLALLRTRAQQRRLITTVILVSIPVAVYGILQHVGIDPLNWDRPVAERVHSTMGNPVFLASALSMTVPLTFYPAKSFLQPDPGSGLACRPRGHPFAFQSVVVPYF